jgi:hypothetical protein
MWAIRGGMGEWLIPTVCKTVALTGYAGSNPAPSTKVNTQRRAHIAQQVEHVLGKNGVTSSNLVVGSTTLLDAK